MAYAFYLLFFHDSDCWKHKRIILKELKGYHDQEVSCFFREWISSRLPAVNVRKPFLGIAVCDVLSFSDCVVDVTQYSLVHRYQCFLEMYCISFPP